MIETTNDLLLYNIIRVLVAREPEGKLVITKQEFVDCQFPMFKTIVSEDRQSMTVQGVSVEEAAKMLEQAVIDAAMNLPVEGMTRN